MLVLLPNCNAEVNGCVLIKPSVLWVPGGSLCTKAILPVVQLISWCTILLSWELDCRHFSLRASQGTACLVVMTLVQKLRLLDLGRGCGMLQGIMHCQHTIPCTEIIFRSMDSDLNPQKIKNNCQ